MEVEGYNIVIFFPPSYAHYRVFDDIIKALGYSLKDLGYKVTTSQNKLHPKFTNIVVGPHILTDKMLDNLPKDVILYNFEHLSVKSSFGRSGYLKALNKFTYWDYSKTNINVMKSRYPDKEAKYVPLGYHPSLETIHSNSSIYQDIDVLFYGALSPRRDKIVKNLISKGIRVRTIFNTYGAERDMHIARSKICLNLHQHQSCILESPRLIHLMSNSKAIVSEVSTNTESQEGILDGLSGVSYDNLVSTCIDLLSNPKERVRLEYKASYTAKSILYSNILKQILI